MHCLLLWWGNLPKYESGGARTAATDVICPMYMRPSWCLEQCNLDRQKRPVILCEYAHAMGNSGGCLSKYWELFRDPQHPRFQGGFIWDFADQGLLLSPQHTSSSPAGATAAAAAGGAAAAGMQGSKRYGYGGDFGDLPNTKQFCCNGITGPERHPFPSAFEAAHLQAPLEVTLITDANGTLVLLVTNRRSHDSLDDTKLCISPCFHGRSLDSYVQFPAFEVVCSGIRAGSFKKFTISQLLYDSLKSAPIQQSLLQSGSSTKSNNCGSGAGSGGTVTLCAADVAVPSQEVDAWLDVSAQVMSAVYSWAPEGFEIMHCSVSNRRLLAIVNAAVRLLSSSPAGGGGTGSIGTGIATDTAITPQRSLIVASTSAVAPQQQQMGSSPDGVNRSSRSNRSSSSVTSAFLQVFEIMVDGTAPRSSTGSSDAVPETASPSSLASTSAPSSAAPAAAMDTPGVIVRWSTGAQAKIGSDCGRLICWYDTAQQPLLTAPVDVCLNRAATDNDRGGALLSYFERWREVGLSDLQRVSNPAGTSSIGSTKIQPDGAVVVCTNWTLVSPPGSRIPVTIACAGHYIFHPSGCIDVSISAVPDPGMPPLPRCGLRWALPPRYQKVRWFGLGPHEAYDDRKAAVYLGVFDATVDQLHTPYTFPQECGRRADPR